MAICVCFFYPYDYCVNLFNWGYDSCLKLLPECILTRCLSLNSNSCCFSDPYIFVLAATNPWEAQWRQVPLVSVPPYLCCLCQD